MDNIYEYMKWIGDFDFNQCPFNEIDNLILSLVSYVPMGEIFSKKKVKKLSLQQVCDGFFKYYDINSVFRNNSFAMETPNIINAMLKTERFSKAKIQNYVDVADLDKNLQFAAMEVVLSEKLSAVVYRGTDDRIVGWKEDFLLSVSKVEAEKMAVELLEKVASSSRRSLVTTGHSKGGHMSVYAALSVDEEIQKRIKKVYSNDGPGFLKEFVEDKKDLDIVNRIVRIIPEESVVGLLFDHFTEPTVIKSDKKKFAQHNMLNWYLDGPHLVKAEDVVLGSKLVDKTLKDWLSNYDTKDIEAFTNDLFSVLEAPGVPSFIELQNGFVKNAQLMAKQINTLSPETRNQLTEMLRGYLGTWTDSASDKNVAKKIVNKYLTSKTDVEE